MEALKKDLLDLLIEGLEEIIKIGSNSTFWGATRANSDALIALTTCLPQFDYYKLRSRCLERVSHGCNENDKFVNWDEEIWDTSIALMALSTDYNNHKEKIIKALYWIKSKYLAVSQSWNEEVWETLLALNAITYSMNTHQENNNNTYIEGSISWINSIYNTPREGILINWSSTALYLLFATNSFKFNLNDQNKALVDEHIKTSTTQILNADLTINDEVLWTSETWSNGLVLWACSEAKRGTFEEKSLKNIIYWFRERLTLEDTPVEDKAFACIGIYKYLEYMELAENTSQVTETKIQENLQDKISKLLNIRVKDFIQNPPLFDSTYYADYYSINLNKRWINITLILIVTVTLTYFSVQASSNSNMAKWLSIIPILLGIYATVSQLANFNIIPTKKKDKADAT